MSAPAEPNTRAADKVLTEKLFKWWDYPILIVLTSFSLFAISDFLFYWFSLRLDWEKHPIFFSTTSLAMMGLLLNSQGRWFILPSMRKPKPMLAQPGWKVAVATTFVSGGEPLEMLEETLEALLALDYPHDTWVLDEVNDDRVKALCLELGAKHFSRKNRPEYQGESGRFQSNSKHGNYNAWLFEIAFARYDIITIFDPDHVPDAKFLARVVGYFHDPAVGYVQAAPAYYNQKASFIARGAAEETYGYFSSIQMASYAMGYPIVVGSHNTHRASALKEMGGLPAHDAEDLLITLLYRARGWQGIYLPEILARGLTPVDWSGYLVQQRRWARSVLDLKWRIYPAQFRHLPLRTRLITFGHGLNYVFKSLIVLSLLLAVGSMLALGTPRGLFSADSGSKALMLCSALLLCEFYRQRFYLDPPNEVGLHWRAVILQMAKWPYHLCAIGDVLFGRREAYALTRKVKPKDRPYLLLSPHLAVVAFLGIAWMIGVLFGSVVDLPLQAIAFLIIAGSLLLILTERWEYPPPYTGTPRVMARRGVDRLPIRADL